MKVLVIGGTLFIGRRLVHLLLEEGHNVAVLHRRRHHDLPGHVENLTADRNNGDELRRALAGRRFDVVFDNVYDWVRGTTAAQVEATVRACGEGLSRYVFMSSCAVYGEGLDHREEDELASGDHPSVYAAQKASSEQALFRLHREEGLPVVTLRPPFIFGPRNPFYREAFFWDRLADGRPIIVPDDGSRLMQFICVGDLAGACIRAMVAPGAAGEAFNIANPAPVTQLDVVTALAAAAGIEPNIVLVPRARIEATGATPLSPDKLYFGEYFDLPPITERTEKAERVLGFQPGNFPARLRETYAWYCSSEKPRQPDYAFEDSLLSHGRN